MEGKEWKIWIKGEINMRKGRTSMKGTRKGRDKKKGKKWR